MPKILKEADNFSSFTWKDLPPEALLFIHEHYFSKEMTAEGYMAAYFGNKVSGIKHEADRLFEEAKQDALERGDFPDELLEVWTKKIIPKDTEEKSSSSFSKANSKPVFRDKSEVKRANLTQQIQQKEDQMDEVSHLNRQFGERIDEFLSASRSYFGQAEELLSQSAYYNPQKASHDQLVLMDVQQHLDSLSHQQMDLLELNSRKLRFKTEDEIDQLYQERNKLVW
ncbi:hypothetical protein KF134_1825 [Lactococcus lactis subsp. lactis]|uniref:hypothetical protein n=1 Tax=Lactococcus lactis TaxID=1358 RepID=UPI00071D95D7|nr:hypothetical protein [Lactococcus lactis]KST91119.1 hypothetical protein KF134_1825 [Lactococcus lactis subsp. lactis]